MKKRTEILLLSAAALLVLVALIIVIRRRGRKVYLNDKYRLNTAYYINVHPESNWGDFIYYNGTLDYVVVPYKAQTVDSDGSTYIRVIAVGELGSDGKVRRMKLTGNNYVDTKYLNL